MKVQALTAEQKAVLAGFTEEQKKITAAQMDLNARIKDAMDAFCMTSGMKQPLVISDDGDFIVEASARPHPQPSR